MTTYNDGSSSASVIAACGLPCGWRGPVSPTTMTGEPPVLREGRCAV
ncbi:hypothetical protein [Nocardia arizonensis]|nr:hypothetical protein [Nocardia arizonensis]